MDSLTTYAIITIDALLVTNVVFARFLGICPYLGVSRKLETSFGMGMAVVFVMTLAAAATWPLQTFVLDRTYTIGDRAFTLSYLQTIVFILIIASLVQLVELTLKKFSPPLYRALGIYLPLITTNCAILGVAILNIQKELGFGEAMVFSIASGIGFTLALAVFAGIRERLEYEDVPQAMSGAPIGLITAGILALAFMGFSGLV